MSPLVGLVDQPFAVSLGQPPVVGLLVPLAARYTQRPYCLYIRGSFNVRGRLYLPAPSVLQGEFRTGCTLAFRVDPRCSVFQSWSEW